MLRTSILDNMLTRGRQFKESHFWWKSNKEYAKHSNQAIHFVGFSDRCSIVSAKVKMGLSQVCHIRQRIFFFSILKKNNSNNSSMIENRGYWESLRIVMWPKILSFKLIEHGIVFMPNSNRLFDPFFTRNFRPRFTKNGPHVQSWNHWFRLT